MKSSPNRLERLTRIKHSQPNCPDPFDHNDGSGPAANVGTKLSYFFFLRSLPCGREADVINLAALVPPSSCFCRFRCKGSSA